MNNLQKYWFEIDTNSIKTAEKAPKKYRENIPEGALYFEAVASNGNVNRNGYKIKETAWFVNAQGKKDLSFVKDYLQNGKILYQHDPERPIGRPLDFKLNNDGQVILSGYVFDNTYSEGNIQRGLVTSISTGHYTHASEFENVKTGETLSEDAFFRRNDPLSDLWAWEWVMSVTSAEIIENSLVTIGSVRGAHIIDNKNYLINKLWVSEDEFNNLLSKNKAFMSKAELEDKVTTPEVEAEEVEPETLEPSEEKTDEKVEDETKEVKTEEIVAPEKENNAIKVETNKVNFTLDEVNELLTNKLSEVKSELTKEFELKLNSLKEEKRKDLGGLVKKADNSAKTEKSDKETLLEVLKSK